MSIVSSQVKIYSNADCTDQYLVTTVSGTTSLTQSIVVTGLNASTNYWAKAFATDNNGLVGESLAQSFSTAATTYIFSNDSVEYESSFDTLFVAVDVSGPTGATFTECGVQFALTNDFSGTLITATNNNNYFSGDVTGFSENTTYYYRFFATTTEYGTQTFAPSQNTITTLYAEPVLSVSVSNRTDTSAEYRVIYSGNYPVTNLTLAIAEIGGEWQDIQIENMSGTQTGLIPYTLTPNTTYNLEFGCDYYDGNPTASCSFTTLAARPVVRVTGVDNITPSSADISIAVS